MTTGSHAYRGTGGFEAGHSTSEDRAVAEALDGTTAHRQAAALGQVRRSGRTGCTWKEVATAQVWHHGQATSALSNLHRRGLIVRLEETRKRCGVYVVPEFAGDRPTVAQGRRYDAQTLARDVPLAILQEAVRLANPSPPHEPADRDVVTVRNIGSLYPIHYPVKPGECDGKFVPYPDAGLIFEHPVGSQCEEHPSAHGVVCQVCAGTVVLDNRPVVCGVCGKQLPMHTGSTSETTLEWGE